MNNIINSSIFNGIQLEPEFTPMQTGKAKGWLGEYHWVSLPVTEENQHADIPRQAAEWCRTQFGSSGSRWFEKDRKFYFKDEKDMSIFILKWS